MNLHLALASPIFFMLATHAGAQDTGFRSVEAPGALLQRGGDGKWANVPSGAAIQADQTLLAVPFAKLHNADKSVEIVMITDASQRGPYPVFETAIQVKPGKEADVKLQRGIIAIRNLRTEGSAIANLRFDTQSWKIHLVEPGTSVLVEIYGRQPAGAKDIGRLIKSDFKEKDVPSIEVVLFVTRGRIIIDQITKALVLKAPPGLARLNWNNVTGMVDLEEVAEMPDSLTKAPSIEAMKKVVAVTLAAKEMHRANPVEVVRELFGKHDAAAQRMAIVGAGALDDLSTLVQAMASESASSREQAIVVLRHWLGRESGQVKRLYESLTTENKMTPVQARVLLQLLVGFDDGEKASPLTYEILTQMLTHSEIRIRTLSHWHLLRLAPAGAEVPYNAAGSQAELEAGQRRWQELIPAGKLPRSTKK